MSTTIQREGTEYIYVGVTGTPPTTVEFAFLAAGARPTTGDWSAGLLILNSGNSLWADALASGASGDYYAARLIGAYGTGGGKVLSTGDYQVWLRLTGAVEQPVRIAPTALTIA